jgi:hypothetical protein
VTTTPRSPDLSTLLAEIAEARAECGRVRAEPEQRRELVEAQKRFRMALEAYAAASRARGLSIPHRLRLELMLYRSLSRSPNR